MSLRRLIKYRNRLETEAQIPIDLHTPLDDMPIAVVDSETTGLDVLRDRIVSFGGYHMQGRKPESGSIDILIDPEMPIAKKAQAVHKIDDDRVQGQGNFSDRWHEIRDFLAGRVIIGHHTAFDIAILHRQNHSNGILWRPEFFLDSGLLAPVLNPEITSLDLDGIASYYGINCAGRHTALGDARITAELFGHLLAAARQAGVKTLRDIYRLQFTRRWLVALQRQEGWLEWLVES